MVSSEDNDGPQVVWEQLRIVFFRVAEICQANIQEILLRQGWPFLEGFSKGGDMAVVMVRDPPLPLPDDSRMAPRSTNKL